MAIRGEPSWWYEPSPSLTSRLLSPAGALWGRLVQRRFEHAKPYIAPVPVICVGNFTAGGAGKTPLALEIGRLSGAMGLRPAFLSRGYGGRTVGPHWVDASRDRAEDVGDEPRLLAAAHPTLICRDRAVGAQAMIATASTPDVIIMDDGLQNPRLAKDLTLAVVDGARGIGNGRVIPAGPLRAPLAFQLDLVDAVIVNRGDATTSADGFTDRLRRYFAGPVLEARIVPQASTEWLEGAPVVAFAGIGVPERFFATIAGLGAVPVAKIPFPDHHPFAVEDAERLLVLARSHGATLVTTEKDHARLAGASGVLATLREAARTLPVRLQLNPRDEGRLVALIEGAISQQRAHRVGPTPLT